VLPFDQEVASVAAEIWSGIARTHRQQLGDILIAAVAISRRLPLVTRNRSDFERLTKGSNLQLRLLDRADEPRRRYR
jgi:predicted nucleic acid-binding protein